MTAVDEDVAVLSTNRRAPGSVAGLASARPRLALPGDRPAIPAKLVTARGSFEVARPRGEGGRHLGLNGSSAPTRHGQPDGIHHSLANGSWQVAIS